MKHRLLNFRKLFILIPFAFGIFILSSCSRSNIVNIAFTTDNNNIKVGEFDLSNYRIKVDYRNGESEEIVVDESMIDKSDFFKLYEVGTHDITFYYDNFYTTATFIVNVNQFNEDIKFKTNGTYQNEEIFICMYDGLPHSLELTENIPVDTQIFYPDGNSFTDCKQTPYTIRAILTKDGYESKTIEGKMLIKTSEFPNELYDKIVFEDLEESFDGKSKSIEATNIPNELDVEYKMFDSTGKKVENAVNVGEYTVNAIFTSKNHNYILNDEQKTKTAKLIITKTAISTSSFSVESNTKTYDGNPITIRTLGILPNDVTYDTVITNSRGEVVTEAKDAGNYNVELIFKCDNNHFTSPSSTKSTLTINKKVMDFQDIIYDLEEVNYDGTEKRYSILDGKLDNYVKPIFTYYKIGESESCTPVEAGKYSVVIDYEIVNDKLDNFDLINIPQNQAILIINGPSA